MDFSRIRTKLKNRIHATLAKYALSLDTDSDIFAAKWRPQLLALVSREPAETQRCMQQELELLDLVQGHIDRLEARLLERVRVTRTIQLIQSVPGPAEIPSIVIDREVGSIDRFSCPKHFAGYAGTVPKTKSSAGKTHYGRMIKQANNCLKWAFIACPGRRPGRRRMSLSGSDITPTGGTSTSSVFTSAPARGRGMLSPWAPLRAT